MTKSELFRKAHALAKATVQAGDDYRATFGAALRIVRSGPTKITLRQVRIGRVIQREFDSREEFVAYCAKSFRPELTTYEAAVAYCEKTGVRLSF